MPIIKEPYIPNPQDKKPETVTGKEETMEEFYGKQEKILEHKLKVREHERALDRLEGSQTPPASKDDVALGKLLIEMVQTERSARQAAEESRTKAEKSRWEVEAARIQDMVDDLKAERAAKQEEPFDIFQKYRKLMEDAKAEITKDLPKSTTAGLDGATAITLEQMRQQHEEKMAELGHNRGVTLEQMKQMHEIAMLEAQDRRLELQMKLKDLEMKSQKSQDAWSDILGIAARTVGGAVMGEQSPTGQPITSQPVAQQKVQTPAGLNVYPCQKCNFPIPVAPELEQLGGTFICPKCGEKYRVITPESKGTEPPVTTSEPEADYI